MKSTPLIITTSMLIASTIGMVVFTWVAFVNGFYWADRYKDTTEIPDSVQAISTLTGWAFWAGILFFILQAIGLVALFIHKKHVK